MPDRANWPPRPRRIVTGALALAYSMFSIVGWSTVTSQTGPPSGTPVARTIVTIGIIVGLGGAAAAVEVLRRKWKSELRAIAGVGGAMFVYNVLDWINVLFVHQEMLLRGPALVTGAWALLVARGGYLYVFSVTTVETKRLRRRPPPRPET